MTAEPQADRPADGGLYELQLVCPRVAAELTTEALQALDALSISSADADAGTDAEDALFGEPDQPPPAAAWTRTRLHALFADLPTATQAARLLALQDFFAQGHVLSVAPVPEQDWVRLTQAQFDPVRITPDFWIVPSWHEVPDGARHVIRLDPGLAFGTGTHPTTAMCLRWIAAQPPTGRQVLDYGCGSGILAMAASLYGAAAVDAVDIDPAAVQATADNATRNHIELRTGLPDAAGGSYDLVIANILAGPLLDLAPRLCGHLAAGGQLLLSGLLQEQAEQLQQAYARWLPLQQVDQQEGWIVLAGQRDRAPAASAA